MLVAGLPTRAVRLACRLTLCEKLPCSARHSPAAGGADNVWILLRGIGPGWRSEKWMPRLLTGTGKFVRGDVHPMFAQTQKRRCTIPRFHDCQGCRGTGFPRQCVDWLTRKRYPQCVHGFRYPFSLPQVEGLKLRPSTIVLVCQACCVWKTGLFQPGFVFCPALRLHILSSTHWACGVDASVEKEKLHRQVSICTHSKLCPAGATMAVPGRPEINWDQLDKRKFFVYGAGIFTVWALAP